MMQAIELLTGIAVSPYGAMVVRERGSAINREPLRGIGGAGMWQCY
ncbi:hypothetical protein [Nibrella saemangeumensis]